MDPEHVTAGEFDRWMKHLDTRFDRVEVSIGNTNTRINQLETERVSKLEIDYKVNRRVSAIIATAVSFVIGLGGLVLQFLWR